MSHPAVFRPLQARFLAVPQAPLCYWLRERFLELLRATPMSSLGTFTDGVAVRTRFLRFGWEVPDGSRWKPYAKGGQYGRWAGDDRFSYDWESDGVRIKTWVVGRYPADKLTLLIKSHETEVPWVSWSDVARGSVGCRLVGPGYLIAHTGPAARSAQIPLGALAAILQSRVATTLLRGIAPTLHFTYRDVMRLPAPIRTSARLIELANLCVVLKVRIVAVDPTERGFGGLAIGGTSIVGAWRRLANDLDAAAAVLHAVEALCEREVFAAYDIAGEDLEAALEETGTPSGWFPLIAEYDAIPTLPAGLDVRPDFLPPLSRELRQALSSDAVAALKRELRVLYEAGFGAKTGNEDLETTEASEDDEDEAALSGARIPIPTETYLEELAQKLAVHPISVYWLLRELRERDEVVCQPELQRFAEDYLSITVLRLLGHRWPSESGSGEAPPEWIDADGVLPLTEGTPNPTLLTRLRERLAADFGAERVNAIEREIEGIIGRSLGSWLQAEFFKRHITQFKRRPIAWQVESTAETGRKRKGRAITRSTSAFSCFVYYHRLDADLLPKLRTQYVGPLRTSLQTELGSLEKLRDRSPDQAERWIEIQGKLDELQSFDARLEEVITQGFASAGLDETVRKEPLDKWTSRDGRATAPGTADALLTQERRYDPDLNDGVRVNIAPLQRVGLLAADVLPAKDVEKAIADRTVWRADERRWCREGKLPRPGWWPVESIRS